MEGAWDAVIGRQVDGFDVFHGRQAQFVQSALVSVRHVTVLEMMSIFLKTPENSGQTVDLSVIDLSYQDVSLPRDAFSEIQEKFYRGKNTCCFALNAFECVSRNAEGRFRFKEIVFNTHPFLKPKNNRKQRRSREAVQRK